ncbi:MAG: hypothetical protein ACQKBT_04870 [Puniceicoccales bacterium]
MIVSPPHDSASDNWTLFTRKQLGKAVAEARAGYDRKNCMLETPFSSPGYHTTFTGPKVHETRQSLKFAVALLDTRDPGDLQIAIEIIHKVISLQDQDPESPTYGIWPWFLEESIAEMDPPDWNWADFCGTQLLEARLTHDNRLPQGLLDEMDSSILHAAFSIKKRDVPLDYTNIVIMGSFVTLMAGELLKNEELINYASDRLLRFYDFTMAQGTFAEYNSPPYTNVALNELRRLQRFVRSPQLEERVDALYRIAWEEIAEYFHPQTGQWSGPHSRCYETMLTPQIEGSIQRALGEENENQVATLDQHRLDHQCPDDLRCHFDPDAPGAQSPRTIRKVYNKENPEILGTTYQHPQFSLGSVSYSNLTNQRRSLLAYWGDRKKTRSLRLRFLHDGYDFTAMQFYSAQSEGAILAGIGFATDGGDRHPHFDRLTNGQFEASDLRLRFEIEGASTEKIKANGIHAKDGRANFELDGLFLYLHTIRAQFGDLQGQMETSVIDNQYVIDIVFYSGPKRSFTFGEDNHQNPVSIVFTATLSENYLQEREIPDATYQGDFGSWATYSWRDMNLAIRQIPGSQDQMQLIPNPNLI